MTFACFFQKFTEGVVKGDHDFIVENCAPLLPVHTPDRLIVYRDRDALRNGLEIYTQILKRGGIVRAQTKLVSQPIKLGRRASFSVRARYFDQIGQPTGDATLNYYCHHDNGTLVVQMVEYLETMMVQHLDEFEMFMAA